MSSAKRFVDLGSSMTIVTTLLLFVAAVFSRGFTHELMLETAVFLVSIKLILMSAKSALATSSLEGSLQEIRSAVARVEASMKAVGGPASATLGDSGRSEAAV